MVEDEIVREVRAAREAFAAAHGYDVYAMVEALRGAAARSGRKVVRLAPRPIAPVEQAATPPQGSQPGPPVSGPPEGV